ncbi:hypothetical protein [Thiohalorhabdus denitrificans]|uniref:hypothetical protein n=1 Tax=Thiohalorhabdus denitrificans TaxID=381306 RepID=UPI00115F9082|nr:hypothetical protein [Thiohalorhabdus denitrificans]
MPERSENQGASGTPTFKGFAHPQGTGLTLSVRGCRWSLTLKTPDGGPYPPFEEYHQLEMTAADLQRFINGRGLDWKRQTGETGREELVAMDNGFSVHLTPALETPLDEAAMVAELEARLA